MEKEKVEILETREALLEMYKAGFLDGYKVGNKARSKEDFIILNRHYKKAFVKRFEKKLNKELRK